MKSIYLVAYYFQRPSGPRVKTNRAGWLNEEKNSSWDEQVSLTKSLSNRDITTAKIILDLANQQVVKNGWLNNRDFDDLFRYFQAGYPNYTTKVMQEINPNYLRPLESSVKTIDTSGSISSINI